VRVCVCVFFMDQFKQLFKYVLGVREGMYCEPSSRTITIPRNPSDADQDALKVQDDGRIELLEKRGSLAGAEAYYVYGMRRCATCSAMPWHTWLVLFLLCGWLVVGAIGLWAWVL